MTPTTSYIICATLRSGTHLLAEALTNTNRAGKPDEYFICDLEGHMENERGNIAELYGPKTLPEFRDLVLELGSTPNGAFGIIIMADYVPMIVDNFRTLPAFQEMEAYELFNVLFHNPKYIWLSRRDKVKQAISIVKALQTKVWRSDMKTAVAQDPQFDYQKIERYRKRLVQYDADWQQYFQDHGIEPYTVVYEDLVETYEETALDILKFLQLPTDNLTFGPRKLRKQADRKNDEWLAYYYAIRGKSESPATDRWMKTRLWFYQKKWHLSQRLQKSGK